MATARRCATSATTALAELITEVETAIVAADKAAEAEREQALDPLASLCRQGPAAMEDAAFRRDRLRTVLPRLQERLADVQAAEYAAQWEPDFEKVQAQRDELTREYAATYPKLVAQLVDLFGRVEAVDREISRINGSAPPGEHRRLLGVELTARGLEHFTTASPSITLGVQLPDFERSTVLAWPLPKQSMAVQVATSMIHHAQARIGGSRARSAGGPCVKSTGVLLLTMTQWRVPERSVKPPRTAPCRRGVPPE